MQIFISYQGSAVSSFTFIRSGHLGDSLQYCKDWILDMCVLLSGREKEWNQLKYNRLDAILDKKNKSWSGKAVRNNLTHILILFLQPQGLKTRKPTAGWKEQHPDSRLWNGIAAGWGQLVRNQLWVSVSEHIANNQWWIPDIKLSITGGLRKTYKLTLCLIISQEVSKLIRHM